MIYMDIGGLLVLLFLLWVFVNVIRAVIFKASRGGGFWGIYDMMTKKDRDEPKANPCLEASCLVTGEKGCPMNDPVGCPLKDSESQLCRVKDSILKKGGKGKQ